MQKRVLLCDDELHIVASARFILKKGGYDVVCCSDGEEAWAEIQKDLPDLLISDYLMPRLDGLELCKRIRDCSRARDLPILMLTGKTFDSPRAEIVDRYGILEVIDKPYSPRALLQRVNRVFETLPAIGTPAS
jgi:DNA-binding response OmpR family regulator